jgi:RNA polymerase sigma factor (sigma-70 family)
MSMGNRNNLLNYLRAVVGTWRNDPRDDAELLTLFAQTRDEEAFRTLVGRHGSLVWQTCRGVLGEGPDAEDAFQITFLILARQASRLHAAPLVGWLFRVARRTALNARSGKRRRQELEQRLQALPRPETEGGDGKTELYAILQEELAGLPERQRIPLALRYLEGKTLEEIARIVGCSRPVLSQRLAKGEETLRCRLSRRGLTVAGGALGALLAQTAAKAAVPAQLMGKVVQAALSSAGERTTLLSLAAVVGVLFSTRALLVALGLLLIGGVTLLAWPARPGPTVESKAPEGTAKKPPAPETRPTVALTGTVTDRAGKPVSNAQVVVLGHGVHRVGWPAPSDTVLGEGKTDEGGEYRVNVPTEFTSNLAGKGQVKLLVRASGFSLRTTQTLLTMRRSESVQLESEGRLRGRLLTPEGEPASGVRINVVQLGCVYWQENGTETDPPPGWPRSVTTDSDGWYELKGPGRTEETRLLVQDDRYGICPVVIPPGKEPAVVTLPRPRELSGRVIDGQSGQPLADVRVVAQPISESYPSSFRPMKHTDREGRFRLRLQPGVRYEIQAAAPDGLAYLGMSRPYPEEGKELTLELLPGVRITGRVVDSEGSPVRDVLVRYIPRERTGRSLPGDGMWPVWTGADGKFVISVMPGRGHLLLNSNDGNYRVIVKSSETVLGQPGDRHRWYADAIVPIVPELGQPFQDVRVTLHKATTVSGTVVDPKGQTVTDGVLLSHHLIWPHVTGVRGILISSDRQFHLPSCEPGRTERVLVLDGKGEFGTVAEVASPVGKERQLTVQLQPCGKAVVRIVNTKGRPIPGFRVKLAVHMPECVPPLDGGGPAEYQEAYWLNAEIYPHPSQGFRTNEKGEVVLPSLIPGVGYHVLNTANLCLSREEIRVTPGQQIEVPMVLNIP